MSQVMKTPQSTFTGPIVVDPLTRIEGHLRIEVEVENGRIKDARSCGTTASLCGVRHPVSRSGSDPQGP